MSYLDTFSGRKYVNIPLMETPKKPQNERPNLTTKESDRVDELLEELKKLYQKEEELKKELRKLLYK